MLDDVALARISYSTSGVSTTDRIHSCDTITYSDTATVNACSATFLALFECVVRKFSISLARFVPP